MAAKHVKRTDRDLNPDPITGEPGAHPVGTGLGAAAGGAAAGAAVGAATGPIGAAVGAVAGAIAGGYAGKAVAEQIDPTVEHAYWREHYPDREYYAEEYDYDTVAPAYQFGWESRARYPGQRWEDVEPNLREE
jgi:phage tail tape-measure protein